MKCSPLGVKNCIKYDLVETKVAQNKQKYNEA